MKVYFNHKADLCETILAHGFTNDIFRSIDFYDVPGVELRGDPPDPNEGCLMPPDGATIVMDIPEELLLEHEVLADDWESEAMNGRRHGGYGYREFIAPARLVNRYERRLYVEDEEEEG